MAVTKKNETEAAIAAETVAADFVDPDAYVYLVYTDGAPKIFAPYGELKAGEIVGARPSSVDGLLASGSFEKHSGAVPEVIRHP